MLDLVDLIQSIITCVTAYIIIKHLNEEETRKTQGSVEKSLIQTDTKEFLMNPVEKDI